MRPGRSCTVVNGPPSSTSTVAPARSPRGVGVGGTVAVTPAPLTTTRTGVGSKPLHGLLICGQLEMSTSTSISARRST